MKVEEVNKIESFLKNNLNLQNVFLSNVSLSSAKKLKKCLTRIYKAMPEVFQYIKGTGDALALYKYIRPFWYNKLIEEETKNFEYFYKRKPNNIETINIINQINKYFSSFTFDVPIDFKSGRVGGVSFICYHFLIINYFKKNAHKYTKSVAIYAKSYSLCKKSI